MSKRLLALLALLLTFGLLAAACGDDDTDAGAAPGDDSGDSTDDSSADDDMADDDMADDDMADDSSADDMADDAVDFGLPDLEGRTVTVAVENAYLPFNYIDPETGEPTGWDYEVIDELCSRLNCVPDYQEYPWEPMIQAVANGQFDMAADGITITDERAQIVDFSEGYINIEQRMLVRLGEDRFTDSASLAAGDFTLGSQIGTTNYDTAVALVGEDRVKPYDEFGFTVQALISGDVDAVIIDETAGQGYQGENADELELIGDSLSSDALGFIFVPGSDLVGPFNDALNSMKADGSLEEISGRYFNDAFTISYDDLSFPEYEDAVIPEGFEEEGE
jgi:polar amino acid transport system substrate-binding protein